MSTTDVQRAIDGAFISRLHLFLVAACSGVMLVDGLDIYMFGKFAPAVAHDFGEPVSRISLVFLLQQIGLTAGSLFISPIADRIGRKPILLASTFLFGIFTLAAAWSQTLLQLAILRGLAGLFLAAVIPNTVALLSEFAPARYRSTFVTIAFAGYMCGGALASLFVIFLLERQGWESAFWIGGLLSLALVPVLQLCAPESLQFRASRDPADPRIARTLSRLGIGVPDNAGAQIAAKVGKKGAAAKVRLVETFTGGMARVTLLLWAIYFIAMFIIALYASFAPTFFYELGHVPLEVYATMSLLTLVVGLAGASTIGFLMDRLGPVPAIAGLFVLEAMTFVAMGYFPFGGLGSIIAFAVFGYCKGAGQSGLNAICSQVYPSRIRSTGVGWAFGLGRLGGTFAPIAGGLLLSGILSLLQVFVVIALFPLILAALLLVLGGVTARSRRDEETPVLNAAGEQA